MEAVSDKDYDSTEVIGVLKNKEDKKRLIEEDLLDNGKLREEIGLKGLMQGLGGLSNVELAKNLGLGYDLLEDIFIKTGLDQYYPDLDTYLHTTTYESLLNGDQLYNL